MIYFAGRLAAAARVGLVSIRWEAAFSATWLALWRPSAAPNAAFTATTTFPPLLLRPPRDAQRVCSMMFGGLQWRFTLLSVALLYAVGVAVVRVCSRSTHSDASAASSCSGSCSSSGGGGGGDVTSSTKVVKPLSAPAPQQQTASSSSLSLLQAHLPPS